MKKIKEYWQDFWEVFWQPDMLVMPGNLAFFFFLSVVPIITLISYGALSLSLEVNIISDFMTKVFGSDIANLLLPLVDVKISLGYITTLLFGFFIASNGASSIIVISNKIYGIKDAGFVKRRIKAIIMTFVLVALFLFVLTVPLLGSSIIELIEFLGWNKAVSDKIILAFNILSGPLSWFIIFFFIKFLLTMAPDRKIPSRYVNYGSMFVSLTWIIITAIYSMYIGNFAHYDVFYGSLANIIILMLWTYFLAYALVIGIGLNFHKESVLEKTAALKLDKNFQNKKTKKRKNKTR